MWYICVCMRNASNLWRDPQGYEYIRHIRYEEKNNWITYKMQNSVRRYVHFKNKAIHLQQYPR